MATLAAHQHGKSKVRVGRVWRQGSRHTFCEWEVDTMLESDMAHAYVTPSNKGMTATDTQKNTVYSVAKRMTSYCTPEEFGIALAKHFVTEYPLVSKAKVSVKLMPWSRYTDGATGGAHNHGFVPHGSHLRTAYITYDDTGSMTVTAGVQDLKVLKTTQSGYAGFIHDDYTLLKDTNERILATSMTSTWKYCSKNIPSDYDEAYNSVLQACLGTFFGPPGTGVYSPSIQYTLYQMGKHVIATVPQVSSIFFNLPNLHFIPITPVNSPPFADDVYVATSEPHGNIEACVTRDSLVTPHCKL